MQLKMLLVDLVLTSFGAAFLMAKGWVLISCLLLTCVTFVLYDKSIHL